MTMILLYLISTFWHVSVLAVVDFEAVARDLKPVFTTVQDFWPPDNGHYGGLFIRLAWHCAGSYRVFDGRGGCDGGAIRFNPELSWADNTNLDKARRLLEPIKAQYGEELSWGDLIILAGTEAIRDMGGPVLGFCGGRTDALNGFDSEWLGPSAKQQLVAPCRPEQQGSCKPPLGSTTLGLIYLNPEGPGGKPLPGLSALDVRDAFSRMEFNISETVALIGGGHAFGKVHGPCPLGAGPSPLEQPDNPWPGLCGTGKGPDTFTSGFEGPWTTFPTKWDNEYFENLLHYKWDKHIGPGGHWQWRVDGVALPPDPTHAPATNPSRIMMLTSDISLLHDVEFDHYVRVFAGHPTSETTTGAGKQAGQAALDEAFSHAWYKLTVRDLGPFERCQGTMVPPPQPFQNPLPPSTPLSQATESSVSSVLRRLMLAPSTLPVPVPALLARLAWACASTFRGTDHRGGCNGARIRFLPERAFGGPTRASAFIREPPSGVIDSSLSSLLNEGRADGFAAADGKSALPADYALDEDLVLTSLRVLRPIKELFGDALSWADLIVLAGTLALEHGGVENVRFCGGRTDAVDAEASTYLQRAGASSSSDLYRESFERMGLSPRDMIALTGLRYSLARGQKPSNELFRMLVNQEWQPMSEEGYRAETVDGMRYVQEAEMQFSRSLVARQFAHDEDELLHAMGDAWTEAMMLGRYNSDGSQMVC